MSAKETVTTGSPAASNEPGDDRIKLLLVDDEEGFVNVLANRLAKRGVEVTKAYSGSESIRILRKQEFDLAVLDLKMEDMDGLEVLRIFKKMDPELAVIMLTGHGSEEAARQGIEFGAVDYLTKPCEIEEILSKIKETFLHRKRA